MKEEHKNKITFESLIPVLQEHTEWIGRVIRKALYPADSGAPVQVDIPKSLVAWGEEISGTDIEQSPSFDQMVQLHSTMAEAAINLMKKGQAGEGIEPADIDGMFHSFQAFITHVLRVGQELSGTNKAVDPETGLGLPAAIARDVNSELERRSRRGNPFCIAMLHIDQLDRLTETYGRDARTAVLAGVAGVILGTKRAFDDAYRMDDDRVLVCLKLADIVDGKSVMERIRSMCSDREFLLPNGQNIRITVSSGVVEPVPGDDPEEVVGFARKTMEEAIAMGGDTVNEYEEVSPLVQYVREQSSKNGGSNTSGL